MIYSFSLRLGTTDFRDLVESNALTFVLVRDQPPPGPSGILNLFQMHCRHEEDDLFPEIRPFDGETVEMMRRDHRMIAHHSQRVQGICDEMLVSSDTARRVALGSQLYLEVNDLFAFFLAHMNNEEAILVPITWEHFTDEQLRGLRGRFYDRIPLETFDEWMRWTLPALNPDELAMFLSGLMTDPPPNRFAEAMQIAVERLSPRMLAKFESEVSR